MIILTKLFFDKDSPFQRSKYSISLAKKLQEEMESDKYYPSNLNDLHKQIQDINSPNRPRTLEDYELTIMRGNGGKHEEVDLLHYTGQKDKTGKSGYYVMKTVNGKHRMPIYYLSEVDDNNKSILVHGRSIKCGLKTKKKSN